MKKILLATTLCLLPLTGAVSAETAARLSHNGIWALDTEVTKAAAVEAGAGAEEIDALMYLIDGMMMRLDAEKGALSVMIDDSTIVTTCKATDGPDGEIALTDCLDGEGKPTEGDTGKMRITADGVLLLEADGFTLTYRNNAG